MRNISEQEMREIFKSFAFGMTFDEIADVYDISTSDAENLLKNNADKVNEVKNYYKEREL